MFAADGGREAIHAGGLSVNSLNLTSPTEIREAVPVAREAALSVKSRSESTNWKTGEFTGLPTAIFQNWLYERNREWHFTDGTLAVLWCVELPNANSDYAEHHDYVASTRTAYNGDRHPKGTAPDVPCVAYDKQGKPVIGRSRPASNKSRGPARPKQVAEADGPEKGVLASMSDSYDDVFEQLEAGPTVAMGGLLAAEGGEITTSPGVYTIWLDEQLLYVGISRTDPRETANKNAKGVFGRLKTYYDGRRTNDLMLALCDRFVTPHLTAGELTALGRGELDLNRMTRTFAHERLMIRAHECSGKDAGNIERIIRRQGLPSGGLPLFNAMSQE